MQKFALHGALTVASVYAPMARLVEAPAAPTVIYPRNATRLVRQHRLDGYFTLPDHVRWGHTLRWNIAASGRQTAPRYQFPGADVGTSIRRDFSMPIPPEKEPVSAPAAATAVNRQELPYRLRQQSLLGEFGRLALQTRDIGRILQRATELCAQGLEASFAKVLEYTPDDRRLLVRAGVGWAPGTIGNVSLGIDMESPAGYAFHTAQIVISNHL